MQENENYTDTQSTLLSFGTVTLTFLYVAFVTTHTSYWTWPSIDVLPIIERFRDSQFLLNDLYTDIGGTFTVRTYFAHFINMVSTIAGVQPAVILVYMSPIMAGTAAVALFTVSRTFGLGRMISFLAAIIPFSLSHLQPKLGLWSLDFNQTTPSALANMFILLALSAAFRNYSFVTSIFIVVATLVHPTTGIVGSILAAAALYIGSTSVRPWHKIIVPTVGCGVIAAFIFFYVPLSFSKPSQLALNSDELYHAYIQIRHPHHYDVNSWTQESILKFIEYSGLLIVLITILKQQKVSQTAFRWGLLLLLFTISMAVSHIVFTNILHNRIAIVFTPVRFFPLAWPFFSIFFFISIRHLSNKSPTTLAAIFLLASVLLLRPLTLHSAVLVCVLILVGSKWFSDWDSIQSSNRFVHYIYKFNTMILQKKYYLRFAIALGVIFFLIRIMLGAMSFKETIISEQANFNLRDSHLFKCIKDAVPEKEAIIVHPSFDSIGVRMHSRRAVYGDLVFPFNELYAGLWWERYKIVHGDTKAADVIQRFDRLNSQELQRIKHQSGVNYLIASKKHVPNTTSLCENASFVLFSLDN